MRIDGRKIAEHRLVVERREGRRLRSDEIVHHVDEDKLNNDPSNLDILTRSEHTRLHHSTGMPSRWSLAEKVRAHDLCKRGYTTQRIASILRRPVSSTATVLQRPLPQRD